MKTSPYLLFVILLVEALMIDASKAFGINVISSRYSNVFTSSIVQVENSVVAEYLKTSSSAYLNTIGREGESLLSDDGTCYYLSQVGRKDSYYPNWAEQPKSLQLQVGEGVALEICPTPLFDKSNTITCPIDKGMAEVSNLVPQSVYWYRILNSAGAVQHQGVFKTEGQLRMLKVDKVINVRDLGGWPAYDQNGNMIGRLAYGKLIRGGTLDGYKTCNEVISQDGINVLRNIVGVKAELDLRSASTDEGSAFTQLGDGVEYRRCAMGYYMNLMIDEEEKYIPNLVSALLFIKSQLKEGNTTYFHCTIGADRTGMLAAIIEAFCGVLEADIVKDWELTSFSTQKVTDSDRFSHARIIDDPDMRYQTGDGHDDYELCELREVFKYLHENHGGEQGKTLREQMIAWLQSKVEPGKRSLIVSLAEDFRSALIEPLTPSPKIIVELVSDTDGHLFKESEKVETPISVAEGSVLSENGEVESSDAFCVTEFINCQGYSHLLLNRKIQKVASFYDEDLHLIETLTNNELDEETVLFDNAEYSLAELQQKGVKYVRFNVPNYSGWTAVLSNRAYLTE